MPRTSLWLRSAGATPGSRLSDRGGCSARASRLTTSELVSAKGLRVGLSGAGGRAYFGFHVLLKAVSASTSFFSIAASRAFEALRSFQTERPEVWK